MDAEVMWTGTERILNPPEQVDIGGGALFLLSITVLISVTLICPDDRYIMCYIKNKLSWMDSAMITQAM